MSQQQTVFESVADIIEKISGVPAGQVTPENRLRDDLEIDSLALIEISVAVVETFQVDLPDEELKELRTVQDVVDRIETATINA
ncbi:acyl carrier protein [Streptomyces sp. NBC_01431]|uniref:acyl carrier protein n=1 Tax=Streptomyces sp. NBC_01431 TaxID=2903863 RepID=UPI002E356B51|nr:acyl carrier protein [Streptomyces sp. NBC_01431]